MRPYILIDSDQRLQETISTVLTCSRIAVDTESNGYYAYYERVCLIQLSTEQDDYIIDMLNIAHPECLSNIFENSSIEKIFHAASNDIGALKRDFQFTFRHVFDTAIACKLLGQKRLGLSHVLEAHFQVQLDKKWQRCDWGARPLNDSQLHYARLDTHYLIPLRNKLHEALVRRGLWPQAQEAFAKVCAQAPPRERFPANGYERLSGTRTLSRRAKAVLRDLYTYRDQMARRLDRAPFRVLSNEALIRLAQRLPKTPEELRAIKGLPQTFKTGTQARQLLTVILDALEAHKSAKARSMSS
ncbi:ribonuclease D [Desulfosoma caldarium]|uniref:Ribonuclease D n=1 Tax=Desulfosoma caldarium TaxID=610254 RepID=A0A3N1VFA1_9BACT|nr:ribonuclease D [Desulfosoma caldarium]ROR01565.1 ribonuclease D [Desulfosoma caldarium]